MQPVHVHLPEQIDLQSRVDGTEVGDCGNAANVMGLTGGPEIEARIGIEACVESGISKRNTTLDRTLRLDCACLEQPQNCRRDHAGVHAQASMVLQRHQQGRLQPSDPELQRRSIADQLGDAPGMRQGRRVRYFCWQTRNVACGFEGQLTVIQVHMKGSACPRQPRIHVSNTHACAVPDRGQEIVAGAETAPACVIGRRYLGNGNVDADVLLQVAHDSRIVEWHEIRAAGSDSGPDGLRHEIRTLPGRGMQSQVIVAVDAREVHTYECH